MHQLNEYFPAITQYTYLNTPAIGLIPQTVSTFRQEQYRDLLQRGSVYFEANMTLNAEVREKIASFFNAEPGYIALMPAFSYGFNAVLEGLSAGAKVLLLDNDYPSVNKAVEARDFQISYVSIQADLEDRIYKAFQKYQPEVFIFSMVQYLNGIKIDFEFLKQLKKEFPETLLVGDGTQYLGTEAFDFKNSGIDVVGASTYKWIGAGFGNGFFMFRPGLEDRIRPKHIGFGSVMGKYKEQGDTLIGKLEGNHLDPSNMGSIKVGLEFHEKLGITAIENQVKELSKAAKTAFTELNLLEDAVVQRQEHSSIFSLKGDEALFEKLQKNNIVCAQRGEGIRVGFHYYNTMEDLEKLLAVLR